jgi:hypothetical protein
VQGWGPCKASLGALAKVRLTLRTNGNQRRRRWSSPEREASLFDPPHTSPTREFLYRGPPIPSGSGFPSCTTTDPMRQVECANGSSDSLT